MSAYLDECELDAEIKLLDAKIAKALGDGVDRRFIGRMLQTRAALAHEWGVAWGTKQVAP